MRSISMPDDIHELAKELHEEMKAIERSKGETTAKRRLAGRKSITSLGEASLDEDSFFIYEEEDEMEAKPPFKLHKSFLPLHFVDPPQLRGLSTESSTSTNGQRNESVLYRDDNKAEEVSCMCKNTDEEAQRAQMVVHQLAGLLSIDADAHRTTGNNDDRSKAIPSIHKPPTTDTQRSPNSIMANIIGKTTPTAARTSVDACSGAQTTPKENEPFAEDIQLGSPSWRSIFSRPVQAQTSNSASAFPAPNNHDEEESDHGSRQFLMISPKRRSNSMPVSATWRMPRKSSMKRISSIVNSQSNSNQSMKRNVSFGKLETREYSIALSDHPSCSYGPPIQLGWEFRDLSSVSVEEYEKVRSPRRSMSQLVLSYNMRRYLLLKRAGCSKNEIYEAMKEVDRVKRERLVTDLFLPIMAIDETMEDVIGRIKTLLDRKSNTS